MYVYAPGSHLEVVYASESITIVMGGEESITDLLIMNQSDNPVSRVHAVYPYAIAVDRIGGPGIPVSIPGSRGRGKWRMPGYIWDASDTWLEPEHSYNRFYSRIERSSTPGGFDVGVSLNDPSEKATTYTGAIRGRRTFSACRFDGERRGGVEPEWRLLEQLGWAAVTMNFETQIEPKEARWLRLVCYSGRLPANVRTALESWFRRLNNLQVDTFEIGGPIDVRRRIIRDLRRHQGDPGVLVNVRTALLSRGLDPAGTLTTIQDWRLNLFDKHYRYVEEPETYGDISSFGPVEPIVQLDQRPVRVFQWKAGSQNVKDPRAEGMFQIRLRARDVPFVAFLMSPISLALSILSIVLALVSLQASCNGVRP